MNVKKGLLFFAALFMAFVLIACDKKLETLTIEGADNVSIEFEEEFNVLDGVSVIGNDGVDYSQHLTYTSTSTIDSETHLLDTTIPGNHVIKYSAEVKGIKVDEFRTVTVNTPPRTGMVINGDFSQGIAGWDKYEADGGTVELSVEDGALKCEIVTGANTWTPRITQMEIPFEQDTVYEVSFKAKASEEGKLVHLQVGELLDYDPWFVDFKPSVQVEYVELTTEWATYSYKFTHILDNKNGGLLFEFGKFRDSDINCTVWLDDIEVEESTADPDTAPPVFQGLNPEVTITTGSGFDPLAGITAIDVVDGDVTDDIEVTIYLVDGEEETEVSDIDTEVVSVYKLVYTVADSAGNEAEEIIYLNVVDLVFEDTEIIKNGDFADVEERPWYVWYQDWGDAPTVSVEFIDDKAVITYDKPGEAGWAIQFNQDGLTLQRGVTYKLQFEASTTAARSINVALEDPARDNQIFVRKNNVALTTDMQVYEYVFTVPHETSDNVKLTFELGATDDFAAGSITIDNVVIYQAVIDPVLYNQDFSITGWRAFLADWLANNPEAELVIVDDELKLDITAVGDVANTYELQIIQDALALGTGGDNEGHISLEAGKTYRLSFDAYASVEGKINIAFGWFTGPDWHPYYATEEEEQPVITDTIDTYTVEFTIDSETDVTELSVFKFEIGSLFKDATGAHYFVVDNVNLEVADGEDYTDTGMIVNGSMEEVVGWFLHVEPGAEGSMAVVDGNLVVTADALGSESFHVHLHNGEESTLSAGNYKFVIKAAADTARDIRANLIVPTGGYYSLLPDTKWDISLTEEVDTFYLDFTIESDHFNNVKIELDFGNLGEGFVSEAAAITIYEINVFKILA